MHTPHLTVSLLAPDTAVAGEPLQLGIVVANEGSVGANEVIITASLPASIRYVDDDSGLEADTSSGDATVWRMSHLAADGDLSFEVMADVLQPAGGAHVVELTVSSASEESQLANNWTQSIVTIVAGGGESLLISALLYDGYEFGDADEAVQLLNSTDTDIAVDGWLLSNGRQETILDSGLVVAGYGSIWLSRDAEAFARQFGFLPDAVVAPWPGFANAGDEVVLRSPDGAEVDSLVYKGGNANGLAWEGAAVWPYCVSGLFPEEGQLLFRRRDESNGLPVPDSDSAEDWAQTLSDPVEGRKLQYPGWNHDSFLQPVVENSMQEITIGVAPDNAFETIVQQIERAQHTILIESLTLENAAIGNALLAATGRGVEVTVLLEGAPATGIADQERYICQRLEKSGAACWFMIRDDEQRIHDRYR